ncbi:MAG: 2-oxoacid:acceptor oxidoreductase family protein, partial [Xanthobacteraceae bacterium]
MTDTARPFTLLIAALGGEGGGVLTDWIVSAAEGAGLPVQSTSIPGVAQRTGATTYYVEIFPTPLAELGGKRPVLALAPGVGDVDVVVASELLEAGRAIANGFVTADRTLLIASVSRVYLTVEKMQMGDGRYDSERLLKAAEQNAQQSILFDMETAAKQAGAIVNAVMLGAIAGSGRMPVPLEAFEAAIKHDGKAVDAN